MKVGADGKMPYSGIVDCFMKVYIICIIQTIQREGVTGLWIGLPIFYTRVGPHAMITLLVQD